MKSTSNIYMYFLCLEILSDQYLSWLKILIIHSLYWLWQYGLWSFQAGYTKLERFLPKNQHPQRKLLNFEYWISGGLRSFQKSEF